MEKEIKRNTVVNKLLQVMKENNLTLSEAEDILHLLRERFGQEFVIKAEES